MCVTLKKAGHLCMKGISEEIYFCGHTQASVPVAMATMAGGQSVWLNMAKISYLKVLKSVLNKEEV